MVRQRIQHFESPTFTLTSEFEENSDNSITKKALVMVEGRHTDSKKNNHEFTRERIQRIVSNTNALLNSGVRVPFIKEHNKSQDSVIGDLNGILEAKVITEDDLPNPKFKHLVGKLGAFASDLTIKAKNAIEQTIAGLITTISPGIDVANDTIREISATVIPAINGLSIYSRKNANFALTLEDALAEQYDMDSTRTDAHDLLDLFLDVVDSIINATEEQLEDNDPEELLTGAIDDFNTELINLLGVNPEEDAPEETTNNSLPPTQQGNPMVGYNNGFTLTEFESNAEFFGNPFAPKKKEGSLIGTVAKGAATVGLLGAGLRYGGLRSLRKASSRAMKTYGKQRMAGAGRLSSGLSALKGGTGSYLRKGKAILGTDINKVKKTGRRAYDYLTAPRF